MFRGYSTCPFSFEDKIIYQRYVPGAGSCGGYSRFVFPK